MMKLLAAAILAACDATTPPPEVTAPDATTSDVFADGHVYRCVNAPDIGVVVFCWNGTRGEMEDQLAPIGFTDWACSTMAACTYSCPNTDACNAKNGCWCPHGTVTP